MSAVTTTRYVARTVMGKPLYIVAEASAINGATNKTVARYSLSEDLVDASKCVNKATARTLISDFTEAKESTRSFKIIPVAVTYELMEDDADE